MNADENEWINKATKEEKVKALRIGIFLLQNGITLNNPLPKESSLPKESLLQKKEVEIKQSAVIGQEGENYVHSFLLKYYRVKDVHTIAKTGDFIVNESIMMEIKNYSSTVPTQEVTKFHRDLISSGLEGGIFVSLKSPISNMQTFKYEHLSTGSNLIPVLYISSSSPEIIKIAVDLVIYEISRPKVSDKNMEKIVEKLFLLGDLVQNLSQTRDQIQELNVIHHKSSMSLQQFILSTEMKMKQIIQDITEKFKTEEQKNSPGIFDKFSVDEKTKAILNEIFDNIVGSWKVSKLQAQLGFISVKFKGKSAHFSISRQNMEKKEIARLISKFDNEVTISHDKIMILVRDSTTEEIKKIMSENFTKK
jgi:hypothetical protein